MARFLTTGQARAFYDRFGAKQDGQGFYEDPPLADLLAHGGFGEARRVFELGCGTGRLAAQLLEGPLPSTCEYLGVDISPTMVALAEARLRPFAPRAQVRLWQGGDRPPPGPWHRFVTTYVLDLLAPPAIVANLAMAHAMLGPEGRLCVVGLTNGRGALGRLVSSTWRTLHALRPEWVGGCRPLELAAFLAEDGWTVEYHHVVMAWGISSEVIVAAPRPKG